MALSLLFHTDAREDLREAFGYYESEKAGLGFFFLEQFEKVKDNILFFPKMYPIVYQNCRKAVLPNFPYIIIYEVLEEVIFILAVFPTRRDPQIWQARAE